MDNYVFSSRIDSTTAFLQDSGQPDGGLTVSFPEHLNKHMHILKGLSPACVITLFIIP